MQTASKKIFGRRMTVTIAHIALLFFATCGMSVTEREEAIVNRYNDASRNRFADFLVEESRYTTDGVQLHRKYYRHLIGIASDIVERKGFAVERGSIGFYFDRISGDRGKLYLGLDIDARASYDQPFENVAVSLIRSGLREIIQTINSCRSIFDERNVVGMVIGWKWKSDGGYEHVNVWILKEDFVRFEDGMLTFSELVQRSTVTNTAGRIIRLPL